MNTVIKDWNDPFPGGDEYKHQNTVVERWAAGKNTSRAFALDSRYVRAAREAIKEWWEAPARLAHRLAGPGGQATSVLRSRLEGCGMGEEHALDAVEEELKARFDYVRKAA